MKCLPSLVVRPSKVYRQTHDFHGFWIDFLGRGSHLADKIKDKKACRILNFALAIGGITVL